MWMYAMDSPSPVNGDVYMDTPPDGDVDGSKWMVTQMTVVIMGPLKMEIISKLMGLIDPSVLLRLILILCSFDVVLEPFHG